MGFHIDSVFNHPIFVHQLVNKLGCKPSSTEMDDSVDLRHELTSLKSRFIDLFIPSLDGMNGPFWSAMNKDSSQDPKINWVQAPKCCLKEPSPGDVWRQLHSDDLNLGVIRNPDWAMNKISPTKDLQIYPDIYKDFPRYENT